ncbi:RNA methyltransferase [uncultured Draconibacterium sp.]|uniref:RNA methyltransferase n=1 Tax=uncultured Draconibacterium sp. TaxID=1573823 RepID=UPI0025F18CF7|nr:RNA methyltransferase [uncultured Draconibacterium sp.]
MIGKSTIKLINSLGLKKYRTKENLFLVEGDKMVGEVLQSELEVEILVVTDHFLQQNVLPPNSAKRIIEVDQKTLKKISLLQHPQYSLAVCQIPEKNNSEIEIGNNLSIYLDGIQDPGNMGTIIRICDWYGVDRLFCSPDCVDWYNPKVIQASMGSFNRVESVSCEFEPLFKLAEQYNVPVFGAFMKGENIYQQELPARAVLVMGNEGKGIRAVIEKQIKNRLSIPNFSTNAVKAESLNVSVATAIICSEFKRNYSK